MVWFGGGRDLANAAEPAIFTHNGNQIAFVGCNILGPSYAWAEVGLAGSRPCGPEVAAQISQLRDAGNLVIATYQYHEDYQYAVSAQQQADFAAFAEAGAAAVSGSQGHHAQSFSFDHGAFIHYGLGNLFFDQMDMPGTRQTFVDTYMIYENRLLSVELWTGLIENYARPRLMTAAEREQLLQTVFQASGW
jgi:poly-gamma-glutamate synthesis protein (capsule biosynthesis protein)